MNYGSLLIVGVAVLAFCVDNALACGGYKLRIIRLESKCGKRESLIKLDADSGAELTKNCEIIPKGCATITKDFNKANAKISVKKNGLVVYEGEMDFCSGQKNIPKEVRDMLEVIGIPKQCPVKEARICPAENLKKVDISKYKKYLPLASGRTIVEGIIQHDTGKTCFKAEIEITK